MYLQPRTGCTSLVQGIHQYYDPQGSNQDMQVGSLSIIQNKQTWDYNFCNLCRWYIGIRVWNCIGGFVGFYQEMIWN